MKRLPERLCHTCRRPARMRGWHLVQEYLRAPFLLKPDAWKKKYYWWCSRHYLSEMFNLMPFICTKTCRKRHERKIRMTVNPDDSVVWMRLTSVFVPAVRTRGLVSVPLKPLSPLCPWCSKPMKFWDGPSEAKVIKK